MAKSKGTAKGGGNSRGSAKSGAGQKTHKKPYKQSGASENAATQVKPVSKKGKYVKPAEKKPVAKKPVVKAPVAKAPPTEMVADDSSDELGEMGDEFGSDIDLENGVDNIAVAGGVAGEESDDDDEDEEVRHDQLQHPVMLSLAGCLCSY